MSAGAGLISALQDVGRKVERFEMKGSNKPTEAARQIRGQFAGNPLVLRHSPLLRLVPRAA
jgi:hypothetical protein